MSYVISGTVTIDASSTIVVIKESDWSVEASQDILSSGTYSVSNLSSGNKTVSLVRNDGKSKSYGNVVAIGNRGVVAGGFKAGGGPTNTIEYISIASLGNSSDFGDLLGTSYYGCAMSNGVTGRAVFGLGIKDGNYSNEIDYFSILTTGNASDFGNKIGGEDYGEGPTSNGTNNRGVMSCPVPDRAYATNVISYITISSTGDAVDFGDSTQARSFPAGFSNGTNNRGIFAHGGLISNGASNTIDYITISTTGNATDFGDTYYRTYGACGLSNGTNNRGIIAGGHDPYAPTLRNNIEYVTITSLGNAADFGDLLSYPYFKSATSNMIGERGLFFGGHDGQSTSINNIEYITITTLGNSVDFGDLLATLYINGATSNS